MFNAGQRIGPYTLIRSLGKGGFGVVWLAERRSQFLTKKVAIKLPHDEQIDFETIRREAEIWEQASGHPNVLPIIDADVYDGQVVIVSEFADGGSLAERLALHGKPSIAETIELMTGILNGLEFLHERQIIHRDIKPQNILLQGGKPRLADFGISRAMQATAASSTVIGTDAYMSPEAFDGKRTAQTDIWSTGVVLYQLLNGALPFPQQHPTERMFAVLTKDFEPLPDSIPIDLANIVRTSLQKLPEYRFASAGAMRAALDQVRPEKIEPTIARTEVLNDLSTATRYSIPIPSDTEAISIRVATEPPEQATILRNAAESLPTQFETPAVQISPPEKATPMGYTQPAGNRSGSNNTRTELITIFGVGLAIIVGMYFVSKLFSYFPAFDGAENKVPIAANSASNIVSNVGFSSSVNVPVNRGSGPKPSTSSNVNSASSLSGQSSPFCRGYIEAWQMAYKAEKGRSGPEIACPDESSYKDRSYEGGKLTGYYQGMIFARSISNTSTNR